jgi:hypothetical protein
LDEIHRTSEPHVGRTDRVVEGADVGEAPSTYLEVPSAADYRVLLTLDWSLRVFVFAFALYASLLLSICFFASSLTWTTVPEVLDSSLQPIK